jgi:type IV pilus assembly protein PilW
MKRLTQRGISTVEILVASAVGLFLTAGVIQLFVSSKQAYRSEEGFARLQENGRYGLEVLVRDLRMHGNMGCDSMASLEQGDQMSVVTSGEESTTYWARYNVIAEDLLRNGQPLVGVDRPIGYRQETATATERTLVNPSSSVTWKAGTDAIVVAGVFQKGVYLAQDMASWGTTLELANNDYGFSDGDLLLITDCRNVDIFEVTNETEGGTSIEHVEELGANRSGQLSTLYRTDSAVSVNAMAFPFAYKTYFIGTRNGDSSAKPSLYVSSMGPGGQVVQEVVDNVEDMVVTFYGEDSDNDGTPDGYERADSVSDWSAVQTARVQLLLRAPEAVMSDQRSYAFDGTTFDDRYQREVYATTVALRTRSEWRVR